MADSQLEFIQLLTANQGRLYAYVLSLVGDPEHARDVMQETNAVLWQKAEEFELGTHFSAWMLKVAYFQVMAHRQKRARDRLVFDDDVASQLVDQAGRASEGFEQRQALLRDCIAKLNDRHRALIHARYMEDADLSSLAASMNRTVNAIRQTLFRARAALIECVRRQQAEAST